MTQCDRVLRHLRDHGTITALEAVGEYGILRLAARISDLKDAGYDIRTGVKCGMNRYGEKTHYAEYKLEENVQ